MDILYLLIPLAILLALGMILVFVWSIRSGQFDDLEGPAHRILMDDDRPQVNNTDDKDKSGQTPDNAP